VKNKIPIYLTILILCFSCTDNSLQLSKEIYGLWALKESFIGSGGSNTTWQVSKGNELISLSRDGQFKWGKTDFLGLNDYDKFKVKSDSNITLFSNSLTDSIIVLYKIREQELTLSYNCFEGCKFRYIKVKGY
jgi:hypothetical protein